MEERVLLGNEAIGLALIEAGVHFVASYPGTPSSEILPAAVRFREEFSADTYIEWSVNEKVAYDNALAASYTGKFAAVIMKQVGLNVASDSLLSSAYTGTVGALLVISCDDPGPHSSQTEQDSRFFAMFAKVPALDPTSPKDAMELVRYGLELSHRHQIPVILRPAVRVSHARQNVPVSGWKRRDVEALFERDPGRWAATPRYRFILHKKLNAKLKRIEEEFEGVHLNAATFLPEGGKAKLGIIATGVPYATVYEILDGERLLDEVPLMRIATPFPAPLRTVQDFIGRCEKVLVVEETDAVVELQIPNRTSVLGRLDGTVPNEGELLPEVVYDVLRRALETAGSKRLRARDVRLQEAVEELSLPVRRPTLCPGCPHRASFFAIKKAIPKGIYTSDIGCYTLGLNLGAVDTCLDMGGAITIATGLSQAFAADAKEQPIVATIGDSTFYHAGMPGLLNAVYNRAKIVLVVLDNGTTAMTGMQPTPFVQTVQKAGECRWRPR